MGKSGLYKRSYDGIQYEARLDVDGYYPQMKLSLSMSGRLGNGHWIADLQPISESGWQGVWEGPVWYRRDKAQTFGVTATGLIGVAPDMEVPDRAKVQYGWNESLGYFINVYLQKSGTNKSWAVWCQHTSDYFRELEAEFDYEKGVTPITSFNPHDDPNHAPGLANETLTVASVYGRAGIRMTESSGADEVAVTEAGGDERWTEQEMHDAMQKHWSVPEAKAWKMWVFSAGYRKEDNPGWITFGIMFDTIGNFQRSGTAVFLKSIRDYYSGAMEERRNSFRTLVHEMGHAFNLLHSWQKELGTPWNPRVTNEIEARSFMNYPYRVAGGDAAYWKNFEYRFSDQELLFLRHAPEDFVIMGGSAFASDHGATAPAKMGAEARGLELVVRTNKPSPVYEFMEVVNVELKLKNGGQKPFDVPETVLADHAHMGITVRRNRGEAKEYKPYAVTCYGEKMVTLKPGDKLYGSLFLSAGKFGWAVSDPGIYEVVVSLHIDTPQGEEIVSSNVFEFAVMEPQRERRQERRQREILAQDFFSDDVGRTLAFGGSLVLDAANEVLEEVAERHPESKAATHAALALKLPQMRECKLLHIEADGTMSIKLDKPSASAGEDVHKILVEKSKEVVDTLGNIAFKKTSDMVAEGLQNIGADKFAADVAANVAATFKSAGVKLPSDVARDVRQKVKSLRDLKKKAAKKRAGKRTSRKTRSRKTRSRKAKS